MKRKELKDLRGIRINLWCRNGCASEKKAKKQKAHHGSCMVFNEK